MSEALGFLAFVALPVAAVLWYYRDNGQAGQSIEEQQQQAFEREYCPRFDVYTVGIWKDGYWLDITGYDFEEAEPMMDGGAFEVITVVVYQGDNLAKNVADYKAANGYPEDQRLEVVVCIWPDGTWCEPSELTDYLTWMSDDYHQVTASVTDQYTLEDYVADYMAPVYNSCPH